MIPDSERPLVLDGRLPAEIVRAVSLLRHGKVVIVPTDTLYGLTASIWQQEAVERVYDIKGRDRTVAVPVLISSAADLYGLVQEVPRVAWRMIESFWPGALTLVLPAGPIAPMHITRGKNTIAVRVPSSRICLQLLQALGDPVVGTSANRSGESVSQVPEDILASLDGQVDGILTDSDMSPSGMASTVVEISDGRIYVHRRGGISIDQIRDASGAEVRFANS